MLRLVAILVLCLIASSATAQNLMGQGWFSGSARPSNWDQNASPLQPLLDAYCLTPADLGYPGAAAKPLPARCGYKGRNAAQGRGAAKARSVAGPARHVPR